MQTLTWYLIIPCLWLLACGAPGGPIFTDDPPDLSPPYALQCVAFSEVQHPNALLMDIAMQQESSTLFPPLLAQIQESHQWVYKNLTSDKHEKFTLFLPTDQAWNTFLAEYPQFHLSGDSLLSLITQHIALDYIPYQTLEAGLPRASAGNSRIIEFSMDQNGCILLNKRAHLKLVETNCRNGMIHLIDQVIVPEHLK